MHLDSNDKRRRKRGIGFRFAWSGLVHMFKTERNFRIHLLATFIVIVAGILLKLNRFEWAIVILTIGLVIAMEVVNTSIETLLDHIRPENHPVAKVIKDTASAAVLVAAIVAIVIGVLVFLPKIYLFF